jgi:hypothetical protein
MRFAKKYHLTLGCGLWLCCVACQPQQQEQVKSEVASFPKPASCARAVDPRPSVKPAARLELLAIGDSIGPRPLDAYEIGESQFRVEPDGFSVLVDTINKHFLFIDNSVDGPQLFYRANPVDTVWLALPLFDKYSHGYEQVQVSAQEANLDGQGQPEVLLTYSSASYGSGGGTTYASAYLLDVTPPTPQLLLQVQSQETEEAFGAYATMHGVDLKPDEADTGYERRVTLHHHELTLGPVKTRGNSRLRDSPLANLPAGRYRYQHGRMYLVK